MKQEEKNLDKRVKSYPQFLFKKSKLAHHNETYQVLLNY